MLRVVAMVAGAPESASREPDAIFSAEAEPVRLYNGRVRLFSKRLRLLPDAQQLGDFEELCYGALVPKDRTQVLCIPSVPANVAPKELSERLSRAQRLVFIADGECKLRYTAIARFADVAEADAAYRELAGTSFTAEEPDRVIKPIHVEATFVLPATGDFLDPFPVPGGEAAESAPHWEESSGGDDEGAYWEIPVCVVCSERLDPSSTRVPSIRRALRESDTARASPNDSPNAKREKLRLQIPRVLGDWSDGQGCGVCAALRLYVARKEKTSPRALQEDMGHVGDEADVRKSDDEAEVRKSDDEARLSCRACGRFDNLWICVVCAHLGCGRYSSEHAAKHWDVTRHRYSMELKTQRIWDYFADRFVHDTRPVRPSSPTVADRTKLNDVAHSYDKLMESQLEEQRRYYEDLIAAETLVDVANADWTEGEAKDLSEMRDSVAQSQANLDLAMERVRAKTEEIEEVREENRRLLENEESLRNAVIQFQGRRTEVRQAIDVKLQDLQAQVEDLAFYVKAQMKVDADPNRDEVREGAVLVGFDEDAQAHRSSASRRSTSSSSSTPTPTRRNSRKKSTKKKKKR